MGKGQWLLTLEQVSTSDARQDGHEHGGQSGAELDQPVAGSGRRFAGRRHGPAGHRDVTHLQSPLPAGGLT